MLEGDPAEPSLYDEALRLLARRGFDVGADRWTQRLARAHGCRTTR